MKISNGNINLLPIGRKPIAVVYVTIVATRMLAMALKCIAVMHMFAPIAKKKDTMYIQTVTFAWSVEMAKKVMPRRIYLRCSRGGPLRMPPFAWVPVYTCTAPRGTPCTRAC